MYVHTAVVSQRLVSSSMLRQLLGNFEIPQRFSENTC